MRSVVFAVMLCLLFPAFLLSGCAQEQPGGAQMPEATSNQGNEEETTAGTTEKVLPDTIVWTTMT